MKVAMAGVNNISYDMDSFIVSSTKTYTTHNVIPVESSLFSLNVTSEVTTTAGLNEKDSEGHKFNYVYVLLPLGALLFITIFTFVVVMVLRKSKMDKLRQHLMPLYNFDPAEEEEDPDWENELLEEDKEQQVALNYNARSPLGGPQLKFHHMDRIV